MKIRNDRGRSRELVPRSAETALADLVRLRLDRRTVLGALAALGATGPGVNAQAAKPGITLRKTPGELLPEGYRSSLIIASGDPLLPGAPAYRPYNSDASIAAAQFGVNNDFITLLPLASDSGTEGKGEERALLFANHEYPNPHLMWPDLSERRAGREMSPEQVATTMAAVGASVCELRRSGDEWRYLPGAALNRRLTATTPMRLSGPAAGHASLRTGGDPGGTRVLGTLSNCNGGLTPWGTVLSCEEGAGWIFAGDHSGLPAARDLQRYYYDEEENDQYGWSRVAPRFRLGNEPNEPNRYEWVVEVDPYDPLAMPVKRTALGRFAHESAQTVLAPDGRLVVYLGDDWENEYCYRFVTARAVDPHKREANRDLLDEGVLSVAHFDVDGTLEWRPLIAGQGPLTEANGFASQADVLVRTRQAADLLGATPMDSPEGFKPHPDNGRIYLALTGNREREVPNPANPRAANRFGHLLELSPPPTAKGPDHAAAVFAWEVLALCGDPAEPEHRAAFHPSTGAGDWFTDPDNLGFDPRGRMWVCTDGVQPQGHDGLYIMPVDGPNRARPRLFYAPPAGAECCSPLFSEDGVSLFLSIQHPGEGAATLDEVETHWPDPDSAGPPRSGVVRIFHADGLPVGLDFDY